MAYAPLVFGAALVKIDAGAGLESFGYTRGGVAPIIETRYVDVPSDRNGGDQGSPAEIVMLPRTATARIRLEMTEWDLTVAGKIAALVRSGTNGDYPETSTLMFQGTKYFRLLLLSNTSPLNFPVCVVRGPFEVGERSSKFSSFVCEFEAHQYGDSPLYDATTS